jgi:predicted glycoside hydrolase/deacetylase ChbG (UPF0249 family)
MKSFNYYNQLLLVLAAAVLFSCTSDEKPTLSTLEGSRWGEKLGFPKDKRVIILHADDAGMCDEANIATYRYMEQNQIQSAAGMVPCEWFDELAEWAKIHPEKDVGVHLTLTSEWKTYRWGPVSEPEQVPGLIDPDGFLWRGVPEVVVHASPEEVENEIRAQIDKSIALGVKPDHIDTHMGTLYGTLNFSKAYLKVAQEYGIPAMVIDLSDETVAERFRDDGYPITKELTALLNDYDMPLLDDFFAVPGGSTYEEKRQNFFALVKSLNPGITEIIFHPSVESDNLKQITNSWQQRVWEAQLFSDPAVIQFFENEEVIFTNWVELMKKYKERD